MDMKVNIAGVEWKNPVQWLPVHLVREKNAVSLSI